MDCQNIVISKQIIYSVYSITHFDIKLIRYMCAIAIANMGRSWYVATHEPEEHAADADRCMGKS